MPAHRVRPTACLGSAILLAILLSAAMVSAGCTSAAGPALSAQGPPPVPATASPAAVAPAESLARIVPAEGQALLPRPAHAAGAADFADPAPDAGAVSARATVATLHAGDTTLKAAIDARRADASGPDVLRLDFSGRGRFDDKTCVPLQPLRGGGYRGYQVPATVIQVDVGGRTVPVRVRGRYYTTPGPGMSGRGMDLYFETAVEGRCAFGDKTHTVRVVNGDGNLHLGDAPAPVLTGGVPVAIGSGDTLLIDTTDGSFAAPVRVFYGQPAPVDGKWYAVTLSADGRAFSATPLDLQPARITVPHDSWTAVLAGRRHLLSLSGGREPILVPGDDYALLAYTERAGDAAEATFTAGPPDGPAATALQGAPPQRVLAAPGGKDTRLDIGSPIIAAASVRQSGRDVLFGLDLCESSGAPVGGVKLAGGQRPDPPRIEVFSGDTRVHAATMEYG